jgi:hypothetical protein
LAIGLARDQYAYLAAAYSMAEYGASANAGLAEVSINPSPGLIIAPQVLTVSGGAASDVFHPIPREAERLCMLRKSWAR